MILNAVTMAKFSAVLSNENHVNQENQGTDNVHVCVKCKPSLVFTNVSWQHGTVFEI